MAIEKVGLRIQVRGVVQGVGFRPFVYNLAESLSLFGWVKNTSSGVEIEIAGPDASIQAFLNEIREHPPALARIDALDFSPCTAGEFTQFEIKQSQPLPGEFLPVSPDVSICEDCERELFDSSNRRFRYPFINCTHCGPRFTIIRDIPYDRPNTTMEGFPLCPDCAREYEDPRDRRFHAQPVACPKCGPQIAMIAQGMRLSNGETALQIARDWLSEGKILAVKGLGGYHLACDATNPLAVAELRRRKKRSDKPFALMAFDVAAIKKYCMVSEAAEKLLLSRERPIVLLQHKPETMAAAEEIAPHLSELGIMLPYTPLHLLLMQPTAGFPDLLVMTSGNLSDEPIAYDDDDAMERLGLLADGFLLHDRPIHMRIDDSVVAPVANQSYFYRRSRGYAPDPIIIPAALPPILATGPELKNTFCLTRDNYAFISHHIGDMENLETFQAFEDGISHYERLFRIQPERIACDLHPNYLSTHYAENRASIDALPLVYVQHHHAHLAACLADNAWPGDEPVIGLCYDGTGYGSDGKIWGGEVFYGGYTGFERKYQLEYVALPGGDQAVRKPARMALSYLWLYGLEWEPALPPVAFLCEEERTILRSQIEHRINTPLTSSMGRLFDAFSALAGVRQTATYEGQAAIQLEACADPHEEAAYHMDLQQGLIVTRPMWEQALRDWHNGITPPVLSARFHNSITALSARVCDQIRRDTGCATVALSGGVWQNRLLLTKTSQILQRNGFTVLIHRQVPPNDGGVALGQAMIAAWQMK